MRTPFPACCRTVALFAAVLCAALPASAEEPKPPKGFTALFNGKDLSGWHGMTHFDPYKLDAMTPDDRKGQIEKWTAEARKHWKVEDGVLVHDGRGAGLATDKEYGDVELLAECKCGPKADHAVYLRSLPVASSQMPYGEWHTFRIVLVGERLTIHHNDQLILDHFRMQNTWDIKLPLRKQGPIMLKNEGTEIRWRNVYVREIPAKEANEILRKHEGDGFRDLFNGKDLTGWDGPLDTVLVKDGAIVNKPNKAGNIYTKEEFGDFVARVEYKLPPGGNNGLAIRYPGKGRPSADGMCEVQILDDDDKQYAKLDPRQYNGSAYGMVAAHRGHLRPTGEWNFMEVTVKGPTIQVELNGTLILDADLSKVTEFKGNDPHPGKDRTSGHFGFAGHNDPVEFRNIQIKQLEMKK
jgi:hypothetical protein